MDMYDGTVFFYVMDPEDPVLAVYRRAFPGVFKDLDQLSPDLKLHLRYPEDLFEIQADPIRDLSHDRSSGLLQPRGSVGGASGEVRRPVLRWNPITS